MNILLDSNILIPLEDTGKKLPAIFAELRRLAQKASFKLLTHPCQVEDINRDKNEERRKITLSRIAQYEQIPHAPYPTIEILALYKWKNDTSNDQIDNTLLFTIQKNACHILVTNDNGIHRKASLAGIGERVHYLNQFTVFLKNQIGEDRPPPLGLSDIFLHELDLASAFFDSLRAGYSRFDTWYQSKARDQRKAWAVLDHGRLLALCIYNIEISPNVTDSNTCLPGRALKLCTLKVSDEWRGRKMGERFLYTAFKHATSNQCNWVYLHTFGKEQETLVELCSEFGFSFVGKYQLRDDVYAKPMDILPEKGFENPLDFARRYYPKYVDDDSISRYIIPIIPSYHDELFPDTSEPNLFNQIAENIPAQSNTIKKAYISHTSIKPPTPGDLVYFYRTRDRKSIQCIGVVESSFRSSLVTEVLPEVSKRTVYNKEQLQHMLKKETLVILFRLIKYFNPVPYEKLLEIGIKMPLQTTRKLTPQIGNSLNRTINV